MTTLWKIQSLAYYLISLGHLQFMSVCVPSENGSMCEEINFESERRLGVRINPCKADAWVNANIAKPEASSRWALGLRMTKMVLIIAVGRGWILVCLPWSNSGGYDDSLVARPIRRAVRCGCKESTSIVLV